MVAVLVGGGPDSLRSTDAVEPFLAHCARIGVRSVSVLLAGSAADADRFAPEYLALLAPLGVKTRVVALNDGKGGIDGELLARCDALVVGGGPTPLYLDALTTHAVVIRDAVRAGVPYLGFSAGAMIAASDAIVGGFRHNGADICPQEWSEGLDELTMASGLGLVPWTIDAHAAQAGTVGRAHVASELAESRSALAIDEDTAVIVEEGMWRVAGSGQVWWIDASDVEELPVLSNCSSDFRAAMP
ncbi:Type 1 glutamine amidotransferase-like domain-containing protein [Brachybacterium tyrofermentans]